MLAARVLLEKKDFRVIELVSALEVHTVVLGMFPLRTVHVRVDTVKSVDGNLITN